MTINNLQNKLVILEGKHIAQLEKYAASYSTAIDFYHESAKLSRDVFILEHDGKSRGLYNLTNRRFSQLQDLVYRIIPDLFRDNKIVCIMRLFTAFKENEDLRGEIIDISAEEKFIYDNYNVEEVNFDHPTINSSEKINYNKWMSNR